MCQQPGAHFFFLANRLLSLALGLFRRSLSFLLLCQSRSLLLLSFRSTFFGGFAVSFGLSAAAGVFFRLGRSSVGLAFGQGAAASIFLRLRLGSSGVGLGPFALFLHAPLISRNTFFLFLAKGQDARVFSGLSGATSGGADWRSALFTHEVVFGACQHFFRFGEAFWRVLFSACCFGNGDRVPRFQQIERDVGPGLRRGKLTGGHVNDVLTALEHVESGIDRFFKSFRFLAQDIFRDHDVARVYDREIGFGGHDQSEGLQVGGDVDFAFAVAVGNDLTQVGGSAFRCDRPQLIREILGA